MKVVVLSDTHLKREVPTLPSKLMQELGDTDLIIHAGDWSTSDVYEALTVYAPVKGVHGNIDDDKIMARFPAKQILDLNGHKIGIVHGDGDGKTTEKRAIDTFKEDNVDIIIFGHSHIPLLRYFKKQLLLNPGSPTDKRTNPYYSYAILQLEKAISVEHVFYES